MVAAVDASGRLSTGRHMAGLGVAVGGMMVDDSGAEPRPSEGAPEPPPYARIDAFFQAALAGRCHGVRIEWVYLVLVLIWGSLMVLVVPPFQAPDEAAHYYRAWSVADLQLVAHSGRTVDLPENVGNLPKRVGSNVMDWSANHYSAKTAWSLLSERISPTHRSQVTTAAAYGPIGYVPQAAAIEFVRVAGHSPLLGMYLGRLFNLIAGAIIVFFAIRLMPFGKALMALVGLLPMTVAQMASVSADGVALSGALLFTAIILFLSQKEALTTKHIVWLGIAAAILLNAKSGYALLALLVFVVVPGQLGGIKRYAVCVGSVLVAAFAISGIVMVLAPETSSASLVAAGIVGIDQGAQLSFVASHPYAFLKVLYQTFEAQAVPLANETYGVLGYLTVGLPYVGMAAVGLAAVLFLGREEPVDLTSRQRIVMLLTGGVLAGAIVLALYLGWSPVASKVVVGLQGRYFIPVVALGLFAVYGIRLRRQWVLAALLVVVVTVAAVTTLATLLNFYY